MAEAMFLHIPTALLLGAALGWLLRSRCPATFIQVWSVSAFVLASLVMPFWMLPVMMDKVEAFELFRVWRDVTLVITGCSTVLCLTAWSPVLRHLWWLEQLGMLVRYAIWYGLAPNALCNAWDASEQSKVGSGLLGLSGALAVAYVASLIFRGPSPAHRTRNGAPKVGQ